MPLTRGAHKGRWIDPAFYNSLLDAYYEKQGWTKEGVVGSSLLKELGISM
jgi:aldehyde:ferredoxin oxidoreductase